MNMKSLTLASLCTLALAASLSTAPATAATPSIAMDTTHIQASDVLNKSFDTPIPPAPEVKVAKNSTSKLGDSEISISSKSLLDSKQIRSLSKPALQSLRSAAPAIDEINKSFTLVQNRKSSPSADFEIKTASKSDLVLQANGAVFIQGRNASHQYGVIESPVGIDATGKKVELSTSVKGSKVSYTVTHPQKAVFPVSTAAAWSYTVAYTWQNSNWPSYVSYKKAAAALKKCFNCSFPLKGAPRTFPVKGQKINLSVMGFKAPVQVTQASKSPIKWAFKTLPGHFDGAGSTIQFSLFSGRNNEFALGVTAKVTSSKIPQWLNKNASQSTWRTFAYRIAREASK